MNRWSSLNPARAATATGLVAALLAALVACSSDGPQPGEPSPPAPVPPPADPAGDDDDEATPRAGAAKGTKARKGKARKGKHPNVVVVIWDTVRADHLTPYGYRLDTTPVLDAFAKEGAVFERAVSPGMWTLPSHASMFTGLPVSEHGANATHKWLDNRFLTVAEHFGSEGYATYLFSANPYVQDNKNMGQGFDAREHPWTDRWKKPTKQATQQKILDEDASNALGPKWKQTLYPTGRLQDNRKDAGAVTSDALFAFVDEQAGDRPFFAVLNYMEAHVPRVPSLASRQALFDEETIQAQLTLDQAFPFLLAYTVRKHEFTDDEVAVITSTYDATLRDLDVAFEALLDGLRERGVLDDTIIVVTSDHGEHLGEHHRIGHKYSVYNPLVRVPLIVRYPAAIEPGTRVAQPVSNLALFASLTDYAGLPTPDQPVLPSLRKLADQPDAVFSELVAATPMALDRVSKVHPDLDRAPWMRTYVSVETDDTKCIEISDGTREVYAMPDDALETQDLSASDPERTEAACAKITAWKSGLDLYDASKSGPGEGPSSEMSAEERAQLEALGYIQGDDEGGHE